MRTIIRYLQSATSPGNKRMQDRWKPIMTNQPFGIPTYPSLAGHSPVLHCRILHPFCLSQARPLPSSKTMIADQYVDMLWKMSSLSSCPAHCAIHLSRAFCFAARVADNNHRLHSLSTAPLATTIPASSLEVFKKKKRDLTS